MTLAGLGPTVRALPFLAVVGCCPLRAAEPPVEEVLKLLVDAAGRPLPAGQIDATRFRRIYEIPAAKKALHKILLRDGFGEVNEKINTFRIAAELNTWKKLVRLAGVPIEVNDAGKKNAALSDMDRFFFTDSPFLPDLPRATPREIHESLMARFERLFDAEIGNNAPGARKISLDALDITLLPGDSLLMDWRMSKGLYTRFQASIDPAIARLMGTPGAYWVPGGYKPEVYTKYIESGTTTILAPDLNSPDGVRVTTGPTRELSLRYRDVPFALDQSGGLEHVLQNLVQGELNEADIIKAAKYFSRSTSPRPLGGFQFDFRYLLLTGSLRVSTVVHTLFGKLAAEGKLPPGFKDLAGVERVIRLMHRIEIDKILIGMGNQPRPNWWADEWANYRPRDLVNDIGARLEYFKVEAQAIARAEAAVNKVDMWAPARRADLAQRAEAAFRAAARDVERLQVRSAAERTFRDVFTREGYSRYRRLFGTEAARRLLTERVRGLYSALVFIKDDGIGGDLMSLAPPEAHAAIRELAEIARSQREFYEEGVGKLQGLLESDNLDPQTKRILTDQFEQLVMKRLRETNPQLYKLMVDLEHNTAPAGELLDVSPARMAEYRAQHLAREAARRSARPLSTLEAGEIAHLLGKKVARTFGDTVHEMGGIGGVDSFFGIVASAATGDADLAVRKLMEWVATSLPKLGPVVGGASAAGQARYGGSLLPLVGFLALIAASAVGLEIGVATGFAALGLMSSWYSLGEHFQLRPTEESALSYVLMGDLSAVLPDFNPSLVTRIGEGLGLQRDRFPALRDQGNLKESAILRQRVPMPAMTAEERRAVLGLYYRKTAEEAATRAGLTPGRLNWRDKRDEVLRAYERDAEYWLRRITLYMQVETAFAAWVRSVNSDPDFRRIDPNPPRIIADMTETNRLADYGDAYIRNTTRANYWDHERVWLRRFFEEWVAEYQRSWVRANKDHGEFMDNLSRFHPGWRKAVVDALVTYYLEGRKLDPAMEDLLSRRGAGSEQLQRLVAEQTRAGFKRIGEGLGDLERIQLEYAAMLERFAWNPRLIERFTSALLQAAERMPAAAPKLPRLSARLYNPVLAAGRPIHAEISVRGDMLELPGDLQTAVDIGIVGPVTGNRPEEVTDFDIRELLGGPVPADQLDVFAAKATFTVASASNPGFRLSAEQPVYYIARRNRPVHKVTVTLGDPR